MIDLPPLEFDWNPGSEYDVKWPEWAMSEKPKISQKDLLKLWRRIENKSYNEMLKEMFNDRQRT